MCLHTELMYCYLLVLLLVSLNVLQEFVVKNIVTYSLSLKFKIVFCLQRFVH